MSFEPKLNKSSNNYELRDDKQCSLELNEMRIPALRNMLITKIISVMYTSFSFLTGLQVLEYKIHVNHVKDEI